MSHLVSPVAGWIRGQGRVSIRTFCGITTDGMLDYLAAIYRMSQQHERVTTSALAEVMCVSAAAASSMLKRLDDSGLVARSNMSGITLTDQGAIAALQVIRRHRLLEVFLVELMGFTWDQVDVEARRLEHAISPAFEKRIATLCHDPTHCPHGDPIPESDGDTVEEELVSALDLQPGQQGLLRRVSSRDASILRYLTKLNLTPGQSVKMIESAPFNGPVTLELIASNAQKNGAVQQVISSELADILQVLPAP